MIFFHALLMFCAAALASDAVSTKAARQVCRVGSFELPCSAAAAFPLFSPECERAWVKGWNPRPLFPDTIEFRRDTVFREGEGAGEAIWTIVDVDERALRAEYVRVAPASHTAHIVVKVEAVDTNRSHVTVSYTVTAFGDHAAALLEAFSEEAYAAKMRNWRRNISAYLETSYLEKCRSDRPR